MAQRILKSLRRLIHNARLPLAARLESSRDALGLPQADPGMERAIDGGISWLCSAQDGSASFDGGVAGWYSLRSGWSASYPETTGYIVPTMLAYAKLRQAPAIRERAVRMLDWLASIQKVDGSFQGGLVGSKPDTSVSFDTGQILLGLSHGVQELGAKYLEPLRKAADWLVATQESEGYWCRFPPPRVVPGQRTYQTHIALALLEAGKVTANDSYVQAAIKNVNWAIGLQHDNGWFPRCCTCNYDEPITHFVAYALRGILAAYEHCRDQRLLAHALKTGEGLLSAIDESGFLPGCLNHIWQGTVEWSCLTGTAQVAECWLLLYGFTGNTHFRDAAYMANAYVRRTLRLEGPREIRGAVKGSFPIDGDYCDYVYPNWAAKFMIDANLLEMKIRDQESGS